MSNIVITKGNLSGLLAAAHNIQSLLDDGTLTAAWGEGKPDDINAAVAAFDTIASRAARIVAEDKAASPFLRYRNEIMTDTAAGIHLRRLVLNLYSEATPVSLRRIFTYCDAHHIRVALDCINHFANHGDRDSQFMTLAMEIAEAMPDGMYNGARVKFDVSDLKLLDGGNFEHALNCMRLCQETCREPHQFFENGGAMFEQIIKEWKLEKKRRAA